MSEYRQDMILFGLDDNEYDGTFGPDLFNIEHFLREGGMRFSGLRMWRAVNLAISICRPGELNHGYVFILGRE